MGALVEYGCEGSPGLVSLDVFLAGKQVLGEELHVSSTASCFPLHNLPSPFAEGKSLKKATVQPNELQLSCCPWAAKKPKGKTIKNNRLFTFFS